MDDELQQLEAELTRLRPVTPAPELAARVERELRGGGTRGRVVRLAWLALPVAAVVAFGVALRSWPPRGGPPAVTPVAASVPAGAMAPERAKLFKPVAAQNLLVASSDDGLVTLPDGRTGRRTRVAYVDSITWKNPRTNASLTWSIPREEVRIVPVTFQ